MIRRGGAAAGSVEATGCRVLPACHQCFAVQKPQPLAKEQILSGLVSNEPHSAESSAPTSQHSDAFSTFAVCSPT